MKIQNCMPIVVVTCGLGLCLEIVLIILVYSDLDKYYFYGVIGGIAGHTVAMVAIIGFILYKIDKKEVKILVEDVSQSQLSSMEYIPVPESLEPTPPQKIFYDVRAINPNNNIIDYSDMAGSDGRSDCGSDYNSGIASSPVEFHSQSRSHSYYTKK